MPAQEDALDLIELLGEINVVVMRILEALDLVPEAVELSGAVRLYLLNGRTVVNAFAVFEHRKSSIRCKVEHPFHYLKNKFGFKKVRYRGIAKNLNKLNILFACVNLIMRDYALKHSVQPTG